MRDEQGRRIETIVLLGVFEPRARFGKSDGQRDVLEAIIRNDGTAKIVQEGWDHNPPIASADYKIVPKERQSSP